MYEATNPEEIGSKQGSITPFEHLVFHGTYSLLK